jgi:RNA polymerase sigma-70 factor (ECF subfamily)
MTAPVTDAQELLTRVQQDDPSAAAALFSLYKHRLVALARSHLDTRIRRKIDPEDVVQSVFRSYFRRQRQGEFRVADWEHLWSLLALMTARKCTNARIFFRRKRRDASLEVVAEGDGDEALASWQALAREPTPEQAAVLADMIEHLVNGFPERDRRIVMLSLEGRTARQIADAIGRAERTVRRVLDHFRHSLEKALLQDPSK